MCRSEINVVDNCAQALCTVLQLGNLFVGQLYGNGGLDAVLADKRKYAEAHVLNAVLAVHHGRNRKGGFVAAEDALADVYCGNGNSVEGSALVFDDLCARGADELLDLVVVAGLARSLTASISRI